MQDYSPIVFFINVVKLPELLVKFARHVSLIVLSLVMRVYVCFVGRLVRLMESVVIATIF